jgi:hypothetical protein
MDMSFGLWNVRSLYRAGSLMTVSRELSRYKLDYLSSQLLSKNLKIRVYTTIILPVVLYGCETWSLTLREEHRLGVFEDRVLRRIFGLKRDEVTGEWSFTICALRQVLLE